jgi:hypothetical protein
MSDSSKREWTETAIWDECLLWSFQRLLAAHQRKSKAKDDESCLVPFYAFLRGPRQAVFVPLQCAA